jgi:hypothetical protein
LPLSADGKIHLDVSLDDRVNPQLKLDRVGNAALRRVCFSDVAKGRSESGGGMVRKRSPRFASTLRWASTDLA